MTPGRDCALTLSWKKKVKAKKFIRDGFYSARELRVRDVLFEKRRDGTTSGTAPFFYGRALFRASRALSDSARMHLAKKPHPESRGAVAPPENPFETRTQMDRAS